MNGVQQVHLQVSHVLTLGGITIKRWDCYPEVGQVDIVAGIVEDKFGDVLVLTIITEVISGTLYVDLCHKVFVSPNGG